MKSFEENEEKKDTIEKARRESRMQTEGDDETTDDVTVLKNELLKKDEDLKQL